MNGWTVIPGFSDYVIANEFPNQIKRISTGRIIKEHINNDGYVHLNLNVDGKQKTVKKHRIVAQTFVPNDDPINKTEVDHLNHDRTDNHISNLRWTTRSTNLVNRTGLRGITYQFVSELPLGSVKVTHYNTHSFDDIYFHSETSVFYKKIADHHFRIMHHTIAPSGNRYVQTMSALNKKINIYNHVVGRDLDTYPAVNEEGNLVNEADEEDL